MFTNHTRASMCNSYTFSIFIIYFPFILNELKDFIFYAGYPTLAVKREIMPAIEILIEFDMVNFSLFSKDTHFP